MLASPEPCKSRQLLRKRLHNLIDTCPKGHCYDDETRGTVLHDSNYPLDPSRGQELPHRIVHAFNKEIRPATFGTPQHIWRWTRHVVALAASTFRKKPLPVQTVGKLFLLISCKPLLGRLPGSGKSKQDRNLQRKKKM